MREKKKNDCMHAESRRLRSSPCVDTDKYTSALADTLLRQ